MPLPDDIDQEKLTEAALAILSLGRWDDQLVARAWKSMDWDLLNLLYDKGWIGDPVGKQKSVVLTDDGVAKAACFLEKHFGRELR